MTNEEFKKYLGQRLLSVRAECQRDGLSDEERDQLKRTESLLVDMVNIMKAGGPGARRVRRDYERRLRKSGVSLSL